MIFTVKEPAEEHIHFPDKATQTQDFQISMRDRGNLVNIQYRTFGTVNEF